MIGTARIRRRVKRFTVFEDLRARGARHAVCETRAGNEDSFRLPESTLSIATPGRTWAYGKEQV